jgi:transposase-like protein
MNAPETQQIGSLDTGQATGRRAEANGMAESERAKQAEADETRRTSSAARKLKKDQEREIARLHAETSTPVSEIASRFGITESSVFQVAQRHGAPLRGGPPARAQPEPSYRRYQLLRGYRGPAHAQAPPAVGASKQVEAHDDSAFVSRLRRWSKRWIFGTPFVRPGHGVLLRSPR